MQNSKNQKSTKPTANNKKKMLKKILISLIFYINLAIATSSSTTTSSSFQPTTPPAPYYACCGFDPIQGVDYQCFDGQFGIPNACAYYGGTVQNGDCFEACPQYLLNVTYCVDTAVHYKQLTQEELPMDGSICGQSWYDLLTSSTLSPDIKKGVDQYIAYRLNLAANNITGFEVGNDKEYAASIISSVLSFSCPLDSGILGPTWISLGAYDDSIKTLKVFNKGKSDPVYNRFISTVNYFAKC